MYGRNQAREAKSAVRLTREPSRRALAEIRQVRTKRAAFLAGFARGYLTAYRRFYRQFTRTEKSA